MTEEGKGETPIFRTAGDRGFIIELGQKIDPEINRKVRILASAIQVNTIQGITEIIPTYRSLLLIYDPLITTPEKFIPLIENIQKKLEDSETEPGEVIQIPVCYGGEFGPDIGNVEKSASLCKEDVIKMHSKPEYLIYMVGFTPGFPFLGGLNEKLFTPRLKTPRIKVPKGSVGIANNQTGMYPIQSPGGWQIIGRTPLNLFNPHRKNPFLYKAGDKIKFVPISQKEFANIKNMEGN
jgi:inhibitor of KinA